MLDTTGTASRNYGTVPWAGSSSSSSNRKKPASFASHSQNRTITKSNAGGPVDENNEVGMTNERQADLRAKIYTMLGDRGSVATAAANATVNSSSSAVTAKDIKKSSRSSGSSSGVSSTAGTSYRQLASLIYLSLY